MFAPANNNAVAPAKGPFIPATGGNDDASLSGLAEEFKANDVHTQNVVLGMILKAAEVAAAANNPVNNNCKAMFEAGAYAAITGHVPAPDPADADAIHNRRRVILRNAGLAENWFVNLINASKKRPLTAENVEGFFASIGDTSVKGGPVANFINQMAPYFPDQVADGAFRALLITGKWTDYRCARTSTGRILYSIRAEFIELRIYTANDPVDQAIINAKDSPWDVSLTDHIPSKVIAYALIYHEAAGRPIDNWYQGKKAVDLMPTARARTAKQLFKRYLDLKAEVNNIDGLANVAAMQNPAVTGFW